MPPCPSIRTLVTMEQSHDELYNQQNSSPRKTRIKTHIRKVCLSSTFTYFMIRNENNKEEPFHRAWWYTLYEPLCVTKNTKRRCIGNRKCLAIHYLDSLCATIINFIIQEFNLVDATKQVSILCNQSCIDCKTMTAGTEEIEIQG